MSSRGSDWEGELFPSVVSREGFSLSLTASICIGVRRPSFIRGSEVARLSFSTASWRRSAFEGWEPCSAILTACGGARDRERLDKS
jgi:hypothetical protein